MRLSNYVTPQPINIPETGETRQGFDETMEDVISIEAEVVGVVITLKRDGGKARRYLFPNAGGVGLVADKGAK